LRNVAGTRDGYVSQLERQSTRLAELTNETSTLAQANARLAAESSASRIDAKRTLQLRAEIETLRDGSAYRAQLATAASELAAERARVFGLEVELDAADADKAAALALARAAARWRLERALVDEALLADELRHAEDASAARALRGGAALSTLRSLRAGERAASLGGALRRWAVMLSHDVALANAQAGALAELETSALSAADERNLYGVTREELEAELHALANEAAERASQLSLARARLQRREDDLVLLLRRHDALEARAEALTARLADRLAGGQGDELGPASALLLRAPSEVDALGRVSAALVGTANERDRWRASAEAADGANASLAAEIRSAFKRAALLERELELARGGRHPGAPQLHGPAGPPSGSALGLGLGERLHARERALERLVAHVHALAECADAAGSKARDARRALFAAAAAAFAELHADSLAAGRPPAGAALVDLNGDALGHRPRPRALEQYARVLPAADVRVTLLRDLD
ncbi:hypothetical protein T492DRAFT_875698, partial [Pavlovales sp. CCMP2436]